jgi:hypothetical protein
MEALGEVLMILLQPLFFLWPALLAVSYVFVVVTIWRIWQKVRNVPV